MYSIKPHVLNFSIQVFCNMTSKNGVGVTEIRHNSESKTFVDGFDRKGSYMKTMPVLKTFLIYNLKGHIISLLSTCFVFLVTNSSLA